MIVQKCLNETSNQCQYVIKYRGELLPACFHTLILKLIIINYNEIYVPRLLLKSATFV